MRTLSSIRLVATALVFAACGGGNAATSGPAKVDIPVRDTSKVVKGEGHGGKQSPPSSTASKPSPFPAVARKTLSNGLGVAVVEAHALPLVHVRVLVGAGMSYGGPAVSTITAEMLKDGGTRTMSPSQLAERIESLGATLSVDTDYDRTIIGLAATKSHLEEALAIVAEVVASPRFDEGELRKLKARMADEAGENARSNGQWAAMRLLFRELYPTTSAYATYDATAGEISKVTGAGIRAFHKSFFVPKNMTVILGGDIDATQATALVDKHFGSLNGGEIPKVAFPPVSPPAKRRVVLAARPGSVQSDVFVASLAPERKTADWPDLRVANQVLGGGVASRLFMDVREQRSLAYSTNSRIVELAHGSEPLIAYAGTETKKTSLSVQGILENYDKISTQPIDEAEVASAGRYLSDIFAVRMESVGSVVDLVAIQTSLGLPDGYWDSYRASVRSMDKARTEAAAKKLFASDKVLVIVSGDGALAPKLARYGEVVVVDPQQDFKTVQTLPENKDAPLE